MAKSGSFTFLCLCLTILLFVQAQAQKSSGSTVELSGRHKKVTLPFKLVHNLIVIPVQINNSPPLNFILDSGVKNILITRLYYSDSLNLHTANEIEIKGLGTGHSIKALYSKGNNMSLKRISGRDHDVYVLMEDVLDISTRMGMPIHGLIGYDLLKNFIVKINYSSKRITFYRPDTEIKIKKKGEIYPLHLEGERAYIYADVRQHNGDIINVKLVVDTGASNTMSLYLPSNQQLLLPPNYMEAYLGRGLGGDINGKIGRLHGFALGRHELSNLPAAYPDEDDIKLALNLSNRNGSLGADILRRFTVIFDYPHNRMALIPNHKFKEPFYFNGTGLEVSTPLPGMNVYVISHVNSGSTAETAGIKSGDQLIAINSRDCKEVELPDILGYLEKKPGSTVHMRILRDGKKINIKLVLENKI
ncbi:aspartyl protease family protein [Botryobacter ruber]|uniref:aspartyl protease family protein n=1 Tax=Botryobacter ruber TaxID=2171629 RepID=UPI000E0A5933|nr:aspartyl protease family protein [Botryobacter ruber]